MRNTRKPHPWLSALLMLSLSACAMPRLGGDTKKPTTSVLPIFPTPIIGIEASPQSAQTTKEADKPASRSPEKDIPYAANLGADPALNSLDIYPPSEGEGLPVMVYVHGGGWRTGDKKNVDRKPSAFNSAGFVFVSINYRLLPDTDVSSQAGDVARAVAWVYARIDEYGGDPTKIFLMGHSAGAHLVALVGTDAQYLESVGLRLADLSGVVALDTQAYDLLELMEADSRAGGRIYQQAFGNDPAFWEQMSPIFHIKSDQNIPPFIVAYSGQGADRPVQAEAFVERLEQVGVLAELLPAPEKTHAAINRQFGMPGDTVTQAVLAFLVKVLE